jgi:polyisoprenoid-binding protein YceI
MMKRTFVAMSLALAVLAVWAPTQAATARWQVKPGEGTRVEFVSKAPMETFTGRTKLVSGACTCDIARLVGDITLEVAVDMASFDTGLSKRNQHMRENHLHTDRFPQAWLRGGVLKAIAASDLPVGGAVSVEFSGELDLHGVRRPVVVPLELSRPTEGTIVVKGAFPVRLADYGIPRPQMLLMKLAEEQLVRVALTLERTP